MNEQKTVLLDCIGQDISKKEFPFDQAANIMAIQHKQERKDWTLSEGQNYELTDGVLTERTNPENSSKGSKARRTEQLP